MKRQRNEDTEIVVRYTFHNRIGAFLYHGTKHAPRTLATCTAYDHPKMLAFVRHWRSQAVLNYLPFSLSYELSYLLRMESRRTLKSKLVSPAASTGPTDSPAGVSPIGGDGSESGHRQDSGVSKPRQDAGSTPASRSS